MPDLNAADVDNTYTIADETFVVHNVHWSEVLKMENEPLPDEEEAQLKLLSKQIESFLNGDPESVKRWRALFNRKTDPLAIWQIVEFRTQLVQGQYRRPTQPPSDSASSPGPTAASSVDA